MKLAPLVAAGLLALAAVAHGATPPPAIQNGGTLVVGVAEPDVLDPAFGHTLAGREAFFPFCEQLYDLDTKGNVIPQLASALPAISSDKLTYTIPLRKGVLFNDGTPFNSAAVVTNLQRDITNPLSFRTSELSSVASVAANGPYSVVLHLKQPYTPLTAQLAYQAGLIASPAQLAKLGDNFGSDPVCVGPFMFQSHTAGDNITYVRSPYYYDKPAVHLDKIVYKFFSSTPAEVAALQTGVIQFMDGVPSVELQAVKQLPDIRVTGYLTIGWSGIYFNLGNSHGVGTPPSAPSTAIASSPVLREAFEMAIDRKAYNKVVNLGTGVPGCTPFSPATPWFDPTIKCTPYDPVEARKLVQQSGISNPTVHLCAGSVSGPFLQAEEQAVGINVILDATCNMTTGAYDVATSGYGGRVDPDLNTYNFLDSQGSFNFSGYSSPRTDYILNNARKALKVADRKIDYHALVEQVQQDRPIIFLGYTVTDEAYSDKLAGIEVSAPTFFRVAFAGWKAGS
jgi:peptide/nickel transport system substrate-binding protein